MNIFIGVVFGFLSLFAGVLFGVFGFLIVGTIGILILKSITKTRRHKEICNLIKEVVSFQNEESK